MNSGYFTLLVFVTSLVTTGIKLPNVTHTVMKIKLKNFVLNNIKFDDVRGVINSSHLYVEVLQESQLRIVTEFSLYGKRNFFVDISFDAAQLAFQTQNEGECDGGPCKKVKDVVCSVPIKVLNHKVIPTFSLFDLNNSIIESALNPALCDAVREHLTPLVEVSTMISPVPPPALLPEAVPVNKSLLIRTVSNVLHNFPEVYGIHPSVSVLSGTTLHLDLEFRNGLQLGLQELLKLKSSIEQLINAAETVFSDIVPKKLSEETLKTLVGNAVGNAVGNTAGGSTFSINAFGTLNTSAFNASVEVVFNDLRCDEDGLVCTLPSVDGIKLQNLRLYNLDGWCRLVTNHLAPFAITMLNPLLQKGLDGLEKNGFRIFLPQIKSVAPDVVPPTIAVIILPIVFVIIIIGTTFFSIWKHRRVTVLMSDGTELPLRRALLEDVTFVTVVLISTSGFLWSNLTSASVLYVGNEFRWMDFNLHTSLQTTYESGALVFALFIFFFSCLYPYIKLFIIVLCTLILQKPDCTALKLIDFFGKFSFLYVYAMLLMNAGLQIKGVTQLKLMPGFYLFVVSTVLSILVGNYAVNFWRHKTSLRKNFGAQEKDVDSGEVDTGNVGGEKNEKLSWRKKLSKLLALRLVHTAIVFACTVTIWLAPIVTYNLNGAVSLFVPVAKSVTMSQLASIDIFLFIICILTTVIAPVLYAFVYPWHLLPATWSAVDALALTAFGGLTQQAMFVRQTLGKKYDPVYGVTTQLHWPLYLLLIYVICQWGFVFNQIFSLTQRIKQCMKKRREKENTSPF